MTTNNDFTTTNMNGTIGTGTGTACNYMNDCAYKLPCGLCRLLMSQCPKDTSFPNISWTVSTNPCTGTVTGGIHNE